MGLGKKRTSPDVMGLGKKRTSPDVMGAWKETNVPGDMQVVLRGGMLLK